MLEGILLWLTVAFVTVAALSVAGFFVVRWLFLRAAERIARTLDRRVGGVAAGAMTHLAAYAQATGLDLKEADRRFGQHIDRKRNPGHGESGRIRRVGVDHGADIRPLAVGFQVHRRLG